MENIQQFIESGILEQYVLGELTPAEQADVEAKAASHPEIREELQQMQAALGFYAEAHAITPPAGMRERVLGNVMAQIAAPTSALRADVDAVAQVNTYSTSPAQPTSATPEAVVRPLSSAPVAEPATRSIWAMAASVALILSLGANGLLYSRWKEASSDLVALQNEQSRFAATTQVVEKKLGELREENQVLRSDEFRAVALAGTKDAPTARARVLFNAATHKVYVDVKSLPALPAGKQYQLWALDNGKPVDAGMLAATTAAGEDIQLMKDIASAQAFAVTVEPTGGSASPTMPIQAMGAVSI
ncbi:anti-sigma factor [Hymenobacter terrenus]|uniref:anti-sigma factor n=1 Tax=Hymenobacter terrenus TaxID=1629124 RepID=UPI0006190CCB|nr:anti-sigma factor [Hymenobacter terrenus]